MSLRFLGQDIGRRLKNINAGVLELADEVDSKSIASDGVRVQVPPPAPSRGNKKDIVPENPDFIGVFAVLGGDFSEGKIVDVKWAFSLCGKI